MSRAVGSNLAHPQRDYTSKLGRIIYRAGERAVLTIARDLVCIIRYRLFVRYLPVRFVEERFMITWTTPTYTEINMSAEIGGYQDDFDERAPRPDDAIQTGNDPQAVQNEA